jgi:hypothetical protein
MALANQGGLSSLQEDIKLSAWKTAGNTMQQPEFNLLLEGSQR